MKKNLLVLLSLLSVMATGVAATACNNNGDSSVESVATSSSDVTADSSSEQATPSIALNETSLSLDIFASTTLKATLQNSTEAIVWTSSDESVAKVVDGVVTAYKAGTATITATAGTLTATCTVTVGEMGVFEFGNLETELRLMKDSSIPLDLTLTYNGVEFTNAEVSVETTGNKLFYQDDELTAVEYGTQNVVVTAKVNGTVVHTHTIAVEVFESGSLVLDMDGADIGIKMSDAGFDLSNFKAMVNGVALENPNFEVTFSEDGVAKNENGKICPVAEGNVTVTVKFTTSQGSYDKIVAVRVYKESFNVGDFLVKGNAGIDAANIGTVAIDLTDKGIDLTTVEKMIVDGEETAFDGIIGDNGLTFTDPAGGAHTIVLETVIERFYVNATFYGHSISTLEELEAWRTGEIAAYTVLLNDIDADGETLVALESGYKAGVLDGLGHTVYNFMMKKGFLHGIGATGGIKNIQFVNFLQDCSAAGVGAVGFGVLAVDNGGTIENVMLKGKLVNVPEADHFGLIYKGALDNSVCKNVFAELYTDGIANHYTGPMYSEGNYTLSNVAIVFNGSPYHKDYTTEQVMSYANMEEFTTMVDLSLWNGWTGANGQFCMNAYDDTKYSVFSFGKSAIGDSVVLYGSSFAELTYEVTEGADKVSVVGNKITVLESAKSGDTFSVAVKDAEGKLVDTFNYTITLEASWYVEGMALAGETVEIVISSKLPNEMFTIEIVEGGEYGTLNGKMLTINADAEVGSIIKIKVSCLADEAWGDVIEFAVSREVIVENSLFNPTSDYLGTATTEETAPAGFENVYKFTEYREGNPDEIYIHGGQYSAKNLNDYSYVTFAVKTPRILLDEGGWNTDNEWLVFALTQTGTAVWKLEVSQNGTIIHTQEGMSGNRDGAPYVYNALNSILFGVPSAGVYVDDVDNTITAYFTEVRGITSVDPFEASLQVEGKAFVGENIDFIITSNQPSEVFAIEILEGGEYATLDGTTLTINDDAKLGSTIKVKISCSKDEAWGGVYEFVVSRETIIENTLFDSTTEFVGVATTEETAPAGFENVHKYVGTGDHLHGGSYSGKNLNDYSEVTFAIKTASFLLGDSGWNFDNEWFVFTLTQTSEAVWSMKVTKNGAVVHTREGLSGNRDGGAYVYNALDSILYGVPATGTEYYVGAVDGAFTVYFTEVRGITTVAAAEPAPEQPTAPVGTIIQDCVYDAENAGFFETTEIATANGFEKLYKHTSTEYENIHGLNFSGINLDNYSMVTFAVKTARFNLNNEDANTSNEWLTFTLTQVSPDTWDLVVTCQGEVVYTKNGLNGAYNTNTAYTDNALDAILYGNPSGFSPSRVDGSLVVYVTELRGISTVDEPEVEPVGTMISESAAILGALNVGDVPLTKETSVAAPAGFVNVYKYEEHSCEVFHGSNYSDIDLTSYSVVTFAVKTPKMRLNTEYVEGNEWLVFTLTQTSEAFWIIEVTRNGELIHRQENVDATKNAGYYKYNSLASILYNKIDYVAWNVDMTVTMYITELRGVLAE